MSVLDINWMSWKRSFACFESGEGGGGDTGGTLKVTLRFKHKEKKEFLLLFCTSKIISQDLVGSQLCSGAFPLLRMGDLKGSLTVMTQWGPQGQKGHVLQRVPRAVKVHWKLKECLGTFKLDVWDVHSIWSPS